MAKSTKNELNTQNEALRKKLRLSSIVIVLLVISLCTVTVVLNNRAMQLPAPEEPLALPAGETEEPAGDPLARGIDPRDDRGSQGEAGTRRIRRGRNRRDHNH